VAERRAARSNGDGAVGTALGVRLRETRTEQGFSLREMARRLDVSPSLVSQIETGKIQPSVRTLYAIVSELGVSLDAIFDQQAVQPPIPKPAGGALSRRPVAIGNDESGYVQRAADRPGIDLETGVRWERMTTRNESDIEFLYTIYPPGSESAPADALVRHNGREFGVVLSGRLGITIGFEDHVLAPGDSVSFDSTTPHRLHNDGREPVTAVWFVVNRRG
jgi:DNA-binding XRE family transcriptional regulator/mannose-6-phosphate isomerase-like protein (cupin superfamily)